MLHPTIVSPEALVPPGKELDAEREHICLCKNKVKLGNCKLVWADLGDGWGYRAVCSQSCYLAAFAAGAA